jgi:hypothetical protein
MASISPHPGQRCAAHDTDRHGDTALSRVEIAAALNAKVNMQKLMADRELMKRTAASIDSMQRRLKKLRPAAEEYQELERRLKRIERDLRGDGPAPRRLPLSARKDSALSLIGERPGLLVKDLAEGMDVSASRVVQILDILEEEGRVVRRKRGVGLA